MSTSSTVGEDETKLFDQLVWSFEKFEPKDLEQIQPGAKIQVWSTWSERNRAATIKYHDTDTQCVCLDYGDLEVSMSSTLFMKIGESIYADMTAVCGSLPFIIELMLQLDRWKGPGAIENKNRLIAAIMVDR